MTLNRIWSIIALSVLCGSSMAQLSNLSGTVRLKQRVWDKTLIGVPPGQFDNFGQSRILIGASYKFSPQWTGFFELGSFLESGRRSPLTLYDQERLDINRVFLNYTTGSQKNSSRFSARLGRQELNFDAGRLIAPIGINIVQQFDGLRTDFDISKEWQITVFATRAVVYQDDKLFGNTFFDLSGTELDGIRMSSSGNDSAKTVAYAYNFDRAQALFGGISGLERRQTYGVFHSQQTKNASINLEFSLQFGSHLARKIEAAAGFLQASIPVTKGSSRQTIDLQLDVTSGDHDASDHTLGTFNPMFPRVSYITEAGFTGLANTTHVKLGTTFFKDYTRLRAATGWVWRTTLQDSIYLQTVLALPSSANGPSRFTGQYCQLTAETPLNEATRLNLEYVEFWPGAAILSIGGLNSRYFSIGIESKF